MLARRLRSYLDRERRGRFNLPKWFPKPLQALRDLSFAQIAEWAYYYKGSMSARGLVSTSTADFLHRAAPGEIWTRTKPSLVWKSQEEVVSRLPPRQVPRVTRAVWPSTPDIFEILEMSRRGISNVPRDRSRLVVENHLTKVAVSSNTRIATRIVRQQIVGIRTAVEVPRKFLRYFRRVHGFLILTTRYKIPIGLVRFLLGQWVAFPTSLWLVQNMSFRTFLKRHRSSDFIGEPLPDTEALPRNQGGGEGDSHLVRDPELLWSLYEPRFHIFQEALILDWISARKGWKTRPSQ